MSDATTRKDKDEKEIIAAYQSYLEIFSTVMREYGGAGQDFTANILPQQRYIDYLSELLAIAGNSICVAVTFLPEPLNKLLISANELHQGSRGNNILKAMELIKGYLSGLSLPLVRHPAESYENIISVIRTKADASDVSSYDSHIVALADKRKVLLSIFYQNAVKYMTATSGRGGFELPQAVVDFLLNEYIATEKLFTDEDAENIAKAFSCFSPELYYAYKLFKLINDNLKKIESHIGRQKFPADFLKALSAQEEYTDADTVEIVAGPNAVALSSKAKVHAETQLISKIIEFVDLGTLNVAQCESIFIGISKGCCLDCHRLITAVNLAALAAGRKTPLLLVSGWHDIDFSTKAESTWRLPLSIEVPAGNFAKNVDEIFKKEKSNIPNPATPGLRMTHPRTNSNASQSADELILVCERNIQTQIIELTGKLLNNAANEEVNLKLRKVLLVQSLCKSETFKEILHNPSVAAAEESTAFSNLFNIFENLGKIWNCNQISNKQRDFVGQLFSEPSVLLEILGITDDKAKELAAIFAQMAKIFPKKARKIQIEDADADDAVGDSDDKRTAADANNPMQLEEDAKGLFAKYSASSSSSSVTVSAASMPSPAAATFTPLRDRRHPLSSSFPPTASGASSAGANLDADSDMQLVSDPTSRATKSDKSKPPNS